MSRDRVDVPCQQKEIQSTDRTQSTRHVKEKQQPRATGVTFGHSHCSHRSTVFRVWVPFINMQPKAERHHVSYRAQAKEDLGRSKKREPILCKRVRWMYRGLERKHTPNLLLQPGWGGCIHTTIGYGNGNGKWPYKKHAGT